MFVYAHRGASALAPENTLSAFDEAIKSGADGIEFDVYQHENEFLVIHDRWVDRTTNGSGTIESMSFEQIRSLDAGDGQYVPTLSETMGRIGLNCQLNIEMKGIHDIPLFVDYIIVHCKNNQQPIQNIVFSSFDHHALKQLKTRQPSFRIAALTANKPIHYALFAQELEAESVNIDVTFVDLPFIEDAKKRNLKVGVFTVNHQEDLLKLKEWGVDAVFCNNPAQALAIINNEV